MEDLHCPSCGEEFNTKTKLPRLFPNCGHTFCSTCIQEMIDDTDDMLSCPEDNIECQFFNKAVGIGCFPLNYALHRFLVQNSGKRATITLERLETKPIEEEFANVNYCNDHSKVCELICLTDRKVICTDCVLFGLHKSHQYTRMDDFKKEVKAKLTTLDSKTESIKYKGFLNNSDKQVGMLREKVQHKKHQLMTAVRDSISSMVEELRLKEREMEEELDSKFNKFDYALSVLDNTAKRLKDRQFSIEKTISKIKAQIKRREFDYGFLMNSLYSDDNIFISLKELVEELVQLENTSVDVIDKELDKYIVEGDIAEVIKLVHNCLEVKCFDPNNSELSPDKKSRQNFDEEIDTKTHVVTPIREKKSNVNIDLRENKKFTSVLNDRIFKTNININSKDNSLILNKSNNDMSRSGINLNREMSESLIDVHIDEMDSELLEPKNSNEESINDQSTSNIQSTSLLSKNMGLKKNASFFKKSAQNKIVETQSPIYQNDMRETKMGFSSSTQANNMVFLPENYRRGEIPHTLYQKNPINVIVPNPRDRFITSNAREKQPSWNDQDNAMYSSKMPKSPVRRPTLTNRFAPISSRQLIVESETEINLSRMNINDHAMPQIITEIIKSKKVKAINLSHNSITEIGFEQLLKKLSGHPTLERIYMMNNYLDDSVFVKLDQWSKKLKKINYFNFQNCTHFKNIVKIKKCINGLAKCGIKIDI